MIVAASTAKADTTIVCSGLAADEAKSGAAASSAISRMPLSADQRDDQQEQDDRRAGDHRAPLVARGLDALLAVHARDGSGRR